MSYIRTFCETYDFDAEAIDSLEHDYALLIQNEEAYAVFKEQISVYEADHHFDSKQAFAIIEGLQDVTGIDRRALDLLYMICLTPHMKALYQKENLPDSLYDESVIDLKWKMRECHMLRKVWGIFDGWWTIDFFKLDRFCFGRLQFNLGTLEEPITLDGVELPAGFTYVDVHIPASGPLIREEYLDSYRRAAVFFRERYGLDPIVFGCHSWVLNPHNETILPPTSRILPFMRDYKIIKQNEDPYNWNLWRIFGVQWNEVGSAAELPADNSQRRAYIKWLEQGGTIGEGFGFFLYRE